MRRRPKRRQRHRSPLVPQAQVAAVAAVRRSRSGRGWAGAAALRVVVRIGCIVVQQVDVRRRLGTRRDGRTRSRGRRPLAVVVVDRALRLHITGLGPRRTRQIDDEPLVALHALVSLDADDEGQARNAGIENELGCRGCVVGRLLGGAVGRRDLHRRRLEALCRQGHVEQHRRHAGVAFVHLGVGDGVPSGSRRRCGSVRRHGRAVRGSRVAIVAFVGRVRSTRKRSSGSKS